MGKPVSEATGTQAGLSGDQQIRICLRAMVRSGGELQTPQLYQAIEAAIQPHGFTLSDQGKASLRFFINKVAVEAGYVHPYDKAAPGWRITAEGRSVAEEDGEQPGEDVIDVDSGESKRMSPSARGDAFEIYFGRVLRAAYPAYAWTHQGRDKKRERGLDFIGARLGDVAGEASTIGVQVKFHDEGNAPSDVEWLKFLAGCFSRQVRTGLFVTTGRLRGEQRREAQEARVIVIEGREEITRHAARYGIGEFDLFGENDRPELDPDAH